MKVINISGQPEGIVRSWLPHDLEAERVVFLPDVCPGKAPLPTGAAVLTQQPDWRRFAVSDCGCGMRLMQSTIRQDDLTQETWDQIVSTLQANKGGLGDLGGGNHFIDALLPYDSDELCFLVHTGSRDESGLVDELVDQPEQFDREFARVVKWAEDNRAAIQSIIESVLGDMQLVLDLPHNTFEAVDGGAIIRKGAVRVEPGDMTVLPSHMSGDVCLLKAKDAVGDILNALSHGTGRTMSRGDAKAAAAGYDFTALRSLIMFPSCLSNASLTTEGPFAYRDIDACLGLLGDYVEEVRRFAVVAYAGHL